MSLQTIAAAAYLVIALNRGRRRKPRWWRRELYVAAQENRNDFYNKLVADDGALFRNFTRMSREDFEYLLEKIAPLITKSDTNFREAIPAYVRLLVTLRYLATGDSYPSLMYLLRISEPSISRIVPEVCRALVDVLHDYIKVSKNNYYYFKYFIIQKKYMYFYKLRNSESTDEAESSSLVKFADDCGPSNEEVDAADDDPVS